MDWKDIADILVNIIGGVLTLPFLFVILIIVLAIVLYGLKLIAIVIDFVLKLFNIDASLQILATNSLIWLIDFIISIPHMLKRTWKISKIIIGILFILSLWLTPLCLNHCISSRQSDDYECEDESYEPGKLRPDKF